MVTATNPWVPGNSTRHHRQPVSLGGESVSENISIVPRNKHRAWHALFDNFSAPQILHELVFYYNIFCAAENKDRFQIWKWNRRRSEPKARRAWNCLFRGMTELEIAEEISRVWLDPAYKISFVGGRFVLAVRSRTDHKSWILIA